MQSKTCFLRKPHCFRYVHIWSSDSSVHCWMLGTDIRPPLKALSGHDWESLGKRREGGGR